MDFGSKFVFTYSDSEEEVISDNELDTPLPRVLVSSESAAVGGTVADADDKQKEKGDKKTKKRKSFNLFSRLTRPAAACKERDIEVVGRSDMCCIMEANYFEDAPRPRGSKYRRWRRPDTNVVAVKFDQLIAPGNMHAGDPFYCSKCQVVLSHIAKLVQQDKDKVWVCEFCGESNTVDLMEEEIPKTTDVTYMLKPAPCTTASGRSGMDQSLVIFIVDTSGSMCMTTEVSGRIKLRGERLSRLQSLNTDGESQYMPGQRRDVTYISRLQAVQAAVDHQLQQMENDYPDRRVALITFNSEVRVVGDGSATPIHFSGDKLGNRDELTKAGKELVLPTAIRHTRKNLGDKIFELEEGGQTALGPALVMAVSMASQVPGSKVIMCTDGIANVGLGTLDTESIYDNSCSFYNEVSAVAQQNGTSVSVITIKGTDCKLVELGKVADATGGQVNIVDPLKLTQEFGSILADPIIATKVTATMLLHARLYFRDEEQQESRLERYVGNVTKETEITFEYGIRKKKKAEKSGEEAAEGACSSPPKSATISKLTELPFQLQIVYTDLEGACALRVLTQTRPVTRDRGQAEKEIGMHAMASHAVQSTARYALEGKYSNARTNARFYNNFMGRNASDAATRDAYECAYDNLAETNLNVNMLRAREYSTSGRCHSDEEDEDDGIVPHPASAPTAEKKEKEKNVKQTRNRSVSDHAANVFYQQKHYKSKP